MNEVLPFLVIGLATGSLYGMAGLGLVITYRTSGIFNFAHGAVAAGAAYLFYTCHVTHGMPWPLAMLISVGALGVLGGLLFERLARSLVSARVATIMVATIGILLFIPGFLFWRYGTARLILDDFLPTGTAMETGGVLVSWSQIIIFCTGVAGFIAVHLLLRTTRLGLAMRAVVGGPDLLALTGTNPAAVRQAAWVIGCSFAALTGVLIAPVLGLDAFLLSALVVQAFGAVAIGRFRSLPWTFAGGLIVGVLASLATKYFERPPLSGLPPAVPFLVLLAVLLATRAGRLPAGAGRLAGETATRTRLPVRVRAVGLAVGVGALIAVPHVVGTRLPVYGAGLALVAMFVSLSLLTRLSGQISLAHAALLAVGAVTFCKVTNPIVSSEAGSLATAGDGVPWVLGLLIAGLVTALVGALLALPAMRLAGLYLALATYGFSLLMENVVYLSPLLFGNSDAGLAGLAGGRPDIGFIHGDDPIHVYYVILAVVAVVCAVSEFLRRARLGRLLRAMADAPQALTTMGLGVNVTRLLVFTLSAFLAGIAGALFTVQVGTVTALSFPSMNSLLFLAALAVASSMFSYTVAPFVAAFLFAVAPSYLTWATLEKQAMLFGAAAVLAALIADREVGVVVRLRQFGVDLSGRLITGAQRRGAGSPVRARFVEVAVPPLASVGGERR